MPEDEMPALRAEDGKVRDHRTRDPADAIDAGRAGAAGRWRVAVETERRTPDASGGRRTRAEGYAATIPHVREVRAASQAEPESAGQQLAADRAGCRPTVPPHVRAVTTM